MAPVTLTGVLLAAVLGCGGLVTAAPATAGPITDPVSGLVGDGSADRGHRDESGGEKGSTHARDGRLRSGCHDYGFRYRLNIRTNDWTLETFLRDPGGENIASGAYVADADPKRNRAAHFRFCRYTTQPGRFTIRAKLVYYNASGEHTVWLERSHFRLRLA